MRTLPLWAVPVATVAAMAGGYATTLSLTLWHRAADPAHEANKWVVPTISQTGLELPERAVFRAVAGVIAVLLVANALVADAAVTALGPNAAHEARAELSGFASDDDDDDKGDAVSRGGAVRMLRVLALLCGMLPAPALVVVSLVDYRVWEPVHNAAAVVFFTGMFAALVLVHVLLSLGVPQGAAARTLKAQRVLLGTAVVVLVSVIVYQPLAAASDTLDTANHLIVVLGELVDAGILGLVLLCNAAIFNELRLKLVFDVRAD